MVCTARRIARSIASGQPAVNRIVSGPDFGEAQDVKTLLAVNDFNAAVLIPELRSGDKALEVITYPGEPHCFAFGDYGPPSSSASTVKAFQDVDAFIRRHIATKPRAVDPALVTQTPFRAAAQSP